MDWAVIVSGVSYPVRAIQLSNHKWLVVGDFMGREVRGEGGTLQGASTKWREAAELYERE